MLILSSSVFLLLPMFFYRKNTIRFYITRLKTVEIVTIREKLLVTVIIITIPLSGVISSLYFSARQALPRFPPFALEYTIFWFRYIFISFFLGPVSEELLFRGILLGEIKECYKVSPRLVIFYQAAAFYGLHIICSGNCAPYLFLIGIITGVFCFYTNSLLYGLVFHICNNIIAALLATGVINTGRIKINNFVVILASIIFICAAFLCFFLFIKYMKKRDVSPERGEVL
jgi:membrane protease YdiL (CAAX protease family)